MTEDAIIDFVSRSFRSVWPVELLSLLSQEPHSAWQIEALARQLRATKPVVTQGLTALAAMGFVAVTEDQAYQLRPASPELAELARELSSLYNRKPRAVLRAIYAAPSDRIQTFADAFRLRKDTC